MPFIDVKTTVKISDEKKESVKAKLGKAISLMRKPESYLMVGFNDAYTLFFAGKKLEKGAYVSVSLFGKPSPSDSEKMTAEICKILESELSIPSDKVYITYHGVENWGWAGENF